MTHLFVDGDYFLTGVTPTSEAVIRTSIDNMMESISTQLFNNNNNNSFTMEQRVVFFSSIAMKFLNEAQRELLITTMRRLRFQTIILDSITSRGGSPVDAAICTKTMSTLSKINNNNNNNNNVGKSQTFIYFAANLYISSALEWVQSSGGGICFVIYENDNVADELFSYVSPHYGSGAGIANMIKGDGVEFIMNNNNNNNNSNNNEAVSVALAALQNAGKELPLGVLQQLKQIQQRLIDEGKVESDKVVKNGDNNNYYNYYNSNKVGSVLETSTKMKELRVPPPIAGAPNPFELDDENNNNNNNNKSNNNNKIGIATAPDPTTEEEEEQPKWLDSHMTVGLRNKKFTGNSETTSHITTTTNNNNNKEMKVTTGGLSDDSAGMNTSASPPQQSPPPPTIPNTTLSNNNNNNSNNNKESEEDTTGFPEPEVSTRLPVGWTLMYDKQRRRHYFVHTNNNKIVQTTWTHPAGIEEQIDLERQVENWYRRQQEQRVQHSGVKENKLTPPAAGIIKEGRRESTGGATTTTTTTTLLLLNGWEECFDPKTGRKYYVNHQTKQTSWNPPSTLATPAFPTTNNTPATAHNNNNNINNMNNNHHHHQIPTVVPITPVSPPSSNTTEINVLPPFWEEKVDPKSGRKFYVNHQTRETTWIRPQPTPAPQTQVPPQPSPQIINQQQQQQQVIAPAQTQNKIPVSEMKPLPPFWEEKVDPKSGRKFYVNHQTRETTWTRP